MKRKKWHTLSSQEFTNQTKAHLEHGKKPLEAIGKNNLPQQKQEKIKKYDNLRKI